jgi:hypothetical protein
MESLRLSVSLVGHRSIDTFVPLVVLSLSSFSLVSRQSYQHSRSSVFFLVTTLIVRDITVGIRLLVAFGFPIMSPLMSLILSSPMLTPLMSWLIFLTWFDLRLTFFSLCHHPYFTSSHSISLYSSSTSFTTFYFFSLCH